MTECDEKIKVYCSTGTVVGRVTNYDYSVIYERLPEICAECGIDGVEHVLSARYDLLEESVGSVIKSNLPCALIHADKEIGILLSNGGDENAKEAMRRWRINCEAARTLGASRAVLHLWGDKMSDIHFDFNLSFIDEMIGIADFYGVRILIENIPCVASDPMTHWRQLAPHDCGFVYDVRFGQFQGQNPEILASDFIKNGKIEHMHIADFGGERRDFAKIRPILHPNEGKTDFELIRRGLKEARYRGTMTLESPVFGNGALDMQKLSRTLSWLREYADDISSAK